MMHDTKKSAPEVALQDGQGMMLGAISIPIKYYTTPGGDNQAPGRVWPLLGIGVDNAVSRAALASMLQVTDRDVRRLVSLERGAGLPICSDVESAGYFRPATLADVERFARSMERRAHHVAQVAEAARRYLDTATGQGRIKEVFSDG